VKLLLERNEIDPESRGNSGRTPLSYIAGHGSEWIVKILLERREADPESQDITAEHRSSMRPDRGVWGHWRWFWSGKG